MRHLLIWILLCLPTLILHPDPDKENSNMIPEVSLAVLGVAQDAGSPHINCRKVCCSSLFKEKTRREVTALGLIDNQNSKKYLFEATPDMPSQLRDLSESTGFRKSDVPDGVFLTHAHIGHYTGLMYFGREAMGANSVQVYAMPMMIDYLKDNGPWSQLIELNNIDLNPLSDNKQIHLSDNLSIIPFRVPHRDEYSETVGYKIIGPNKTAIFIPDINKWEAWDRSIIEEIKKVDYAFLDATFYSGKELDNRDMREIPHPFVVETMKLLADEPLEERNKIWFIHMNHTNPMLDSISQETKNIKLAGYHIARKGIVFGL